MQMPLLFFSKEAARYARGHGNRTADFFVKGLMKITTTKVGLRDGR
jgi:hypothetical protein